MTIYEQYSKEICSNCKNRKECKKELRRKVDGSIKCRKYERDREK